MRLRMLFVLMCLLTGCELTDPLQFQKPKPIPANQQDVIRCAWGDKTACDRIDK